MVTSKSANLGTFVIPELCCLPSMQLGAVSGEGAEGSGLLSLVCCVTRNKSHLAQFLF